MLKIKYQHLSCTIAFFLTSVCFDDDDDDEDDDDDDDDDDDYGFLVCFWRQLSQSLDERRLRPAGGGRGQQGQVSLKDLCVEDKRRIANLIKELAK